MTSTQVPLEVGKIIRDIKKSQQSYCGVPGKFLSIISSPISFPLSRMFNNMFGNGFFPENFKLAHVTSIWKQKGVKSSKLFYRPISLLPTLSKCLESIIHKRLLSHFIEHSSKVTVLLINFCILFTKLDLPGNKVR